MWLASQLFLQNSKLSPGQLLCPERCPRLQWRDRSAVSLKSALWSLVHSSPTALILQCEWTCKGRNRSIIKRMNKWRRRGNLSLTVCQRFPLERETLRETLWEFWSSNASALLWNRYTTWTHWSHLNNDIHCSWSAKPLMSILDRDRTLRRESHRPTWNSVANRNIIHSNK